MNTCSLYNNILSFYVIDVVIKVSLRLDEKVYTCIKIQHDINKWKNSIITNKFLLCQAKKHKQKKKSDSVIYKFSFFL